MLNAEQVAALVRGESLPARVVAAADAEGPLTRPADAPGASPEPSRGTGVLPEPGKQPA